MSHFQTTGLAAFSVSKPATLRGLANNERSQKNGNKKKKKEGQVQGVEVTKSVEIITFKKLGFFSRLGTVPKFLHLPRNGHARISPRPPPSPLETGDLQLSDTV